MQKPVPRKRKHAVPVMFILELAGQGAHGRAGEGAHATQVYDALVSSRCVRVQGSAGACVSPTAPPAVLWPEGAPPPAFLARALAPDGLLPTPQFLQASAISFSAVSCRSLS